MEQILQKNNYVKNYISSSYPAHIVMIIDQSSMMSEPYSKGKTKAEYVVDDINNFINQLIFMCCAGDNIKDWFYISIVGHSNNEIKLIESKYLSEFAENPIRIVKVKKTVADGAGGWVEIEEEKAEYINPYCEGVSNLFSAFKHIQVLISDWMNQKQYLSTLIINISGGYTAEWQMTTKVIEKIKNLKSNGENSFLFNWLLDSNSSNLEFPSLDNVYENSFTSHLFFEWSSYMSGQMIDNCKRFGFNVHQGAKFFSNKGINNVLNLINIGS